MRASGRRFTAADDAELKRLVSDGVYAEEIARRLGRNPCVVRKRAAALGLVITRYIPSRDYKRPDWIERAQEMSAAGLSHGQIAERVGATRACVRYWLRLSRCGVWLDRDLIERLHDAAKARRVTASRLAERVLNAVIEDNILDAVLDDGGAA